MVHTFKIHGMSCKGCRKHVEDLLSEIEHVKNVSVNLENYQAEIETDEHIPLEKLQKAFKNDGGSYAITNLGAPALQPKEKKSGKGTGVYYCPMHCEGDKTYDKFGDCPVCGMDLVEEISLQPSATQYICPMRCEGENL